MGDGRSRAGFDRLTPYYDPLAMSVFGNRLRAAQSCFLSRLPAESRVLVVGGGSGWFLEQLLNRTDCSEVVYQDISPRMLARAEERVQQRLPNEAWRVRFVEAGVAGIPGDTQFDAICTHCFIDLFSEATLSDVTKRLSALLGSTGVWYVSDFCIAEGFPMAGVSRSLLWVMYRFFDLTCGIEADRLPDLDRAWEKCGLRIVDERLFYGGMIRSVLLGRSVGRADDALCL